MTTLMSNRWRLDPSSYAGPDRRAAVAIELTTVRFTVTAACLELAAAFSAWQFGEREMQLVGDPARLATLLTAGAIGVSVSGGIVATGRFVLSKHRASLDMGIMMLLISVGWFIQLRLATAADVRDDVYRAVALGIAITVLALVAGIGFSPPVDAGIDLRRRVPLMLAAPLLFGVAVRVGAVPLDAGQIRNITVAIAAIATVTALAVGLLRSHWLLTFVGLQLLGVQLSEAMGLHAVSGNESWLVAAGLMAVSAACMGLYGAVLTQRQYHAIEQIKQLNSHQALEHVSRIAREEHNRNQDRMHSLRSGLLGVEAVAASIAASADPVGVGQILATEASRLRQLTSNVPLQVEDFDLVPALNALIDAQLRRGIAVTLEAPPRLYIRAAKGETLDAVHSLIDNAIRHAPRSPITVTAGWGVRHDLELSVKDRGPGVPEKMRSKIFQRGVTTHSEGTGLGLHVCSKIAEAQGGELTYGTRLGGGSVFTFQLPPTTLAIEEAQKCLLP